MINAQEYINQKYSTKKEREQVTELDISNKNLEENLDLRDFTNLEKLDCSYNQLTGVSLGDCKKIVALRCSFNQINNLNLNDLTQLERISCNDNRLVEFDYFSLNPSKLIILNISDNN